MNRLLFTLVSTIFLFCGQLYAQKGVAKQEQETGIERDDFPAPALPIVDLINSADKRIKYYKEIDGERSSFEAKFKRSGNRISAEFDQNGKIQDVEIKISKREIEKAALLKIRSQLDTVARKYRIEKVQQQYLFIKSDPQSIEQQIKKGAFQNYELVVAFKDKRKIYRREYLFSHAGELISFREVKRLEYDFLLF
jgi:hypothetical protein